MVGQGRLSARPDPDPIATPVARTSESFGNRRCSPRFGTEGSEVQILSPRPISPCEICTLSLADRSVPLGLPSNRRLKSHLPQPLKTKSFEIYRMPSVKPPLPGGRDDRKTPCVPRSAAWWLPQSVRPPARSCGSSSSRSISRHPTRRWASSSANVVGDEILLRYRSGNRALPAGPPRSRR